MKKTIKERLGLLKEYLYLSSIISVFLILIISTLVNGCVDKTAASNIQESTKIQEDIKIQEGAIKEKIKEKGLLGVFYYPWTGGNPEKSPDNQWLHWKDGKNNPPKTWASNYLPDYSSGFDPYNRLYSSKDIEIIKKQLVLMKKAGIDFVISSWWGQNHYTDQTLDIIFNQVLPSSGNADIKFAIYYEKEGFADTKKSDIINDINYIKNKYARSPYYLKIDGKPVIFVYNTKSGRSQETSRENALKWKEIRDETDIYTDLKIFNGYQNIVNYADSWHEYAPATKTGFKQVGNYSALVTPGFHKWNESPRLIREDFKRFEYNVITLKNSDVQFKLIETWNEWGEGTGIEPAQKINMDYINGFTPDTDSYGTKYIDILGKYFNDGENII